MKKCSVENCNTEIQAWQVKCAKHYQEEMQQQGVAEPPPEVPPAKTMMPKNMEKIKDEVPIPKYPKAETKNLTVQEKIEIRQVCLQCAIDLITKTEFEDRTFDTLRGEIETLTEEFYNIIVKNL